MKQLLEILEDLKPGVTFEGAQGLIERGVLDSLDIITLVSEINDEFDVEVTVNDIRPENFNSVEAMMDLITRLQGED